jgi:hypothetical protein
LVVSLDIHDGRKEGASDASLFETEVGLLVETVVDETVGGTEDVFLNLDGGIVLVGFDVGITGFIMLSI